MDAKDLANVQPAIPRMIDDVVAGRVDRRGLSRNTTRLGLSATAAHASRVMGVYHRFDRIWLDA